MPTKKDEIAQKLIDWHFEVEPEITKVRRSSAFINHKTQHCSSLSVMRSACLVK